MDNICYRLIKRSTLINNDWILLLLVNESCLTLFKFIMVYILKAHHFTTMQPWQKGECERRRVKGYGTLLLACDDGIVCLVCFASIWLVMTLKNHDQNNYRKNQFWSLEFSKLTLSYNRRESLFADFSFEISESGVLVSKGCLVEFHDWW